MITRWVEVLRAALARRGAPRWIALLAALLALPTLTLGFFLDDGIQLLLLQSWTWHPGGVRGDWDVFRFQSGDPAWRAMNLARGWWPWWLSAHFKLAFLRPVASLALALDAKVLGVSAVRMHAETVALYAGVVAVAARAFRVATRGPAVAALAALLFAVDDAHGLLAAWISNRHALLSALFGIPALEAHIRARRDGWAPGRWLAPSLFALSLLSGESAFAVLAYLAAWTLWNDRATRRDRARSLAPYAAITAVWVLAYVRGGYGASGGDFYIDPARQPALFARAVVERAPLLLLGQFAFPWSELWPTTTVPQALLVSAALAWPVWRFWRAVRDDPHARFWLTGMLLSLPPLCATWPNDRLLLFAGIGAAPLCATFLARVRDEAAAGRASRPLRALAGVTVLFHLALAPPSFVLRSTMTPRAFTRYEDAVYASLAPDFDGPPGRTLVLVSAPDPMWPMYAGTRWQRARGELGLRLRILGIPAGGEAWMDRVDARTLDLTLSQGWFADQFSRVFRSTSEPLAVGAPVRVPGLTATVRERTADGRPRTVRFAFDAPLEDPRYVWRAPRGKGYAPFAPPAQGRARVPVVPWMEAALGP